MPLSSDLHAFLRTVADALKIQLPEVYVELVMQHRLAEGEAAPTDLCTLYAVGELVELNQAYEVQRHLPRFLLIGSDGGDGGILLRADGMGDCNLYRCDLGALAEDELAILAPSPALWQAAGFPCETVLYEPRYLTTRLNDPAWHAQMRVTHLRGFLQAQLDALPHSAPDAATRLRRAEAIRWLLTRVAP